MNVKQLNNYITNIASASGISPDIIKAEHRHYNKSRDFVFVNRLQGKHIPARPDHCLALFEALADEVNGRLSGAHSILVIGFAETATAIGNALAHKVNNCTYYMQTTREEIDSAELLVGFEEKHSQAAQQYLFGDRHIFESVDYVLFAEDEISTGNTVLNFIAELNRIKPQIRYGVASICNWQDNKAKEKYARAGIDTFALITGEIINIHARMPVTVTSVADVSLSLPDGCADGRADHVIKKRPLSRQEFDVERAGYRIPRNVDLIERTIASIMSSAATAVNVDDKILVLGTEEYMYAPLRLAGMLGKHCGAVYYHATTRSCIDIIDGAEPDEIFARYRIRSNYEESRPTYIYNLQKYDKVFIVTDKKVSEWFRSDMVGALASVGNEVENIHFIQMMN